MSNLEVLEGVGGLAKEKVEREKEESSRPLVQKEHPHLLAGYSQTGT